MVTRQLRECWRKIVSYVEERLPYYQSYLGLQKELTRVAAEKDNLERKLTALQKLVQRVSDLESRLQEARGEALQFQTEKEKIMSYASALEVQVQEYEKVKIPSFEEKIRELERTLKIQEGGVGQLKVQLNHTRRVVVGLRNDYFDLRTDLYLAQHSREFAIVVDSKDKVKGITKKAASLLKHSADDIKDKDIYSFVLEDEKLRQTLKKPEYSGPVFLPDIKIARADERILNLDFVVERLYDNPPSIHPEDKVYIGSVIRFDTKSEKEQREKLLQTQSSKAIKEANENVRAAIGWWEKLMQKRKKPADTAG